MQTIYDANNSIEANLLKNLLQQEGIEVFIRGEFLQGGIGELPAIGLVSLMVDDADVERAADIVQAWQQGEYALPSSE